MLTHRLRLWQWHSCDDVQSKGNSSILWKGLIQIANNLMFLGFFLGPIDNRPVHQIFSPVGNEFQVSPTKNWWSIRHGYQADAPKRFHLGSRVPVLSVHKISILRSWMALSFDNDFPWPWWWKPARLVIIIGNISGVDQPQRWEQRHPLLTSHHLWDHWSHKDNGHHH